MLPLRLQEDMAWQIVNEFNWKIIQDNRTACQHTLMVSAWVATLGPVALLPVRFTRSDACTLTAITRSWRSYGALFY